ncbi:MAG: hypothetical protein U0441_16380 [Polyangiaceae bacterium]
MDEDSERLLESILDEAEAPYRAVLPPAQLAVLRGALREELLADGTARRLISAARPRSVPKRSGEAGAESPAPSNEGEGRLSGPPKRQAG